MFIRPQLRTLKSRDQQVSKAAGAPGCPYQALGTVRERRTRDRAVAGEKTATLTQRRLSATISEDILLNKPWEQGLHSWSQKQTQKLNAKNNSGQGRIHDA